MLIQSDTAANQPHRVNRIVINGLLFLVLTGGIAIAEYTSSNKIFTYQGRLYDNGSPADGEYDLMFYLLDGPDPNEDDAVTWEEVYDEHTISDGYFTVDLNFAAFTPFTNNDLFDGSPRWLRIGIRPGELKDPNEYTFIYPLTKLNAAPFAHLAHRLRTPAELRCDTNEPTLTIANDGAGPELRFVAESALIKYENDASINILDDYLVNIGNSQTRFVDFDSTEEIGHDRTITIDRNESKTIGANSQTTVTISRSATVGGNDSTIIGGVSTVSTGGDLNRSAGEDLILSAESNIHLSADDIVLVQGGAVVSKDPNNLLKVDGAILMKPMDTHPPLTDGYGKLFVGKLDNKPYFLDANDHLYDLTAVKGSPVSFVVKRDASYNWPTNSTFETVDFSSDSTIWDNTGNGFMDKTNIFVVPAEGIYTFHGVICFTSMVKGDLIGAAISIDGRRFRGDIKTASGETESVRVDITIYLGKEQQVKLEGYVSTTSPPVVLYGAGGLTEAFTYFSGAKVD